MIVRSIRFFLSILLIAVPALASPVTGRVVDPDDRPVADARVIASAQGQPLRSAVTNARGEFSLDLPESGMFELRVAADGLRAEQVRLNAAEVRDIGVIKLTISAVSEAVVVSAAQVEIPLSRSTSTVTILTGEELRARQIHSVADALRTVPGLTVVATGATGAATSVFPRGGESNYTLVLVDDVPVNAFGGDYDFGHLSTENVERVEIVRGPQSALFGSNAIGAVVRIVTRRGGPPTARGTIEAGGYDTFRVAASTAGSRNAFEWGASVDRLTSDNYNGHTTRDGLHVTNDDYVRTAGALSAGWRRGDTQLRAQLQHATDEKGTPGPFGTNPVGIYTEIDDVSRGNNSRTLAAGSGTFVVRSRARVGLQAAYNRIDSDFASGFGPSESNSNRWLGRGQVDFPVASWLELSAGGEAQRERTGSTFITGETGGPIQVKRRTAALFAEARITRSSGFATAAGFRVDDIHRERIQSSPSPFSPRPVLDAGSVISFNPRASFAWTVAPGSSRYTRIRGGVATGIRPPDGFELAFTDNPGLKPERSFSAEGAVEQVLAGGRVQLDAIAFYNDYDDLIVTVGSFTGSSRFRSDNIANARARGVELGASARHRLAARSIELHGRIAYTFLDTDVLTVDNAAAAPPPFSVGDPLLRRPRHQVFIDAGVSAGRFAAFVTGRSRGRALDVEPSFGTFGGLFYADGFNVWNAGASWRLHRSAEIFGRVENLFDRTYEEALGFPALGRRATIGLRVAASR